MDIRPTINTSVDQTGKPVNKYLTWPIWASVVMLSLVVSAYVLLLSWLNKTSSDADPLERAADAAAHDYAAITVSDPALGDMAVRDSAFDCRGAAGSAPLRIRSLNTIQAVLKQSLNIAARYHLKIMQEQVEEDRNTANAMADKLHVALENEISPSGAIYQRARRLLARNVPSGERFIALKITAGRLKKNAAAPEPDGFRTLLAAAADFEAIPLKSVDRSLPTTLLLEADYASKKTALVDHRRICIIVGSLETRLNGKSNAQPAAPQATVIALNFPQGRPPEAGSLAELFLMPQTATGKWLQTVGGAVPGPGRLAPPITPVLSDMNCVDALSITFYHWLRQMDRPPSETALKTLIENRWPSPDPNQTQIQLSKPAQNKPTGEDAPEGPGSASEANSCMVADSDARSYAFINQSGTNEAGQTGLSNCFSSAAGAFPPQALPLVVAADGKARLAGRNEFDRLLIRDLLLKIYGTSLAAQETLATSKLIENSAAKSLRSARENLLLAQADLIALKDRLHSGLTNNEKKILQEEVTAREENLTLQNEEIKRLTMLIALARTARSNAASAASQCFELSSRLFQVSRSGIYRMSADGGLSKNNENAFLLGKHFVFIPRTDALGEAALLDKAAELCKGTGSDEILEANPWLGKKLTVFCPLKELFSLPDTKIFAEGKSLSDLMAEDSPVVPAAPQTIILDSRVLYDSRLERQTGLSNRKSEAETRTETGATAQTDHSDLAIVLSSSPFNGLPVTGKQLVYYCPKAMSSGTDEAQVSWSCVSRDLVAYREKENRNNYGEPLQSPTQGWCRKGANENSDSCPGLAGEWQLRRPLVLLDDQSPLKGTTLANPQTGQRIPQVPPAGPPLM